MFFWYGVSQHLKEFKQNLDDLSVRDAEVEICISSFFLLWNSAIVTFFVPVWAILWMYKLSSFNLLDIGIESDHLS